jgi:threonine dehydratase
MTACASSPGPQSCLTTAAPLHERVTRAAIEAVEPLIRPYLRVTPVIGLDRSALGLPAGPLTIKLEQLQHIGSFKARGAFANLLLRDVPAAGVVAASGGNHGAAVAYAAGVTSVPARIFVPTVSSAAKISRIRGYGADLVVEGATYSDALALSEQWAAASGAMPVHAFDQLETVLGAGTVALELRRQAPEVSTVLAGVGGGGLLSGIAGAYAGQAAIIGAEPEGAPTMTEALKAGRPVDAPAGSVAVDSLAPRRVGELTYAMISQHAERVVLVSDEEIVAAQQLLWDTLRIAAEPGACAALAALLSGRYEPAPDEHVAVIVSGANTTAVNFGRLSGRSARRGAAYLQVIEQRAGGGRHGVHRLVERFGVVPGGLAEAADLPDILERGGAHVRLGRVRGVGLAQGLDAAAHISEPTLSPDLRGRHTMRLANQPLTGTPDTAHRPGRSGRRAAATRSG